MSIAPTFGTDGLATKDDRGTGDAAIPAGDEPEDHEDNTFGLPDGQPIRRELKRWYGRIAAEVLGTLPEIGAPVPHGYPDLTDYADPMAAAMTPLLSAYWDEAGQLTRERLGLDPDGWRVIDPHVHEMIQSQAMDFCESTLQTTTETVQDAYTKLREELQASIIDTGEAGPALRKRVQSIFTTLSRDHADMIARTEASRAVNRAGLQSAIESGVCSGKKWLASGHSCQRCLELERRTAEEPVPLETPFLTGQSDKAAYADIPSPPLHPFCRCTFTLITTEEWNEVVEANPPAGYEPGPMGPEPRNKSLGPQMTSNA